MTNETIKRMLDACYMAKRVREMLPPLPKGVMPSYIRYLDTIQTLREEKKDVRISDISDAMCLPRPDVTRTVKEMEAKGYLSKTASAHDGRVTFIDVTETGKELSKKYDADYFGGIAPEFSEISDEEAQCMIETVGKMYRIMRERERKL